MLARASEFSCFLTLAGPTREGRLRSFLEQPYMKTILDKDLRSGWQAISRNEIKPGLELEISTRKDQAGNLTSRASAWHLLGDGTRRHAFGFGSPTGDFSCVINKTRPARVLEKTVVAQHELSLSQFELLKAQALDFYVSQAKAQKVEQQELSEMAA
jgi:hypothetical protein